MPIFQFWVVLWVSGGVFWWFAWSWMALYEQPSRGNCPWASLFGFYIKVGLGTKCFNISILVEFPHHIPHIYTQLIWSWVYKDLPLIHCVIWSVPPLYWIWTCQPRTDEEPLPSHSSLDSQVFVSTCRRFDIVSCYMYVENTSRRKGLYELYRYTVYILSCIYISYIYIYVSKYLYIFGGKKTPLSSPLS